MPARRVALRPPAFPMRPIPACRRFFPALCRPRPLRGLSLPDAGSVCRVVLRAAARVPRVAYPCAPRVLSVRRGKGGYWQGASACLRAASPCARPPAFPVRPIPAPARVIRTALSLRAAGFARPPREGRILAGIQRPPASSARPNPARRGFCPPRYPARRPPPGFVRPRLVRSAARVPCAAYPCLTPVLCAASSCAPPPASPVWPIPARRGFCPSAAGKADIGREPARAVPAASPCAPARVLRAA